MFFALFAALRLKYPGSTPDVSNKLYVAYISKITF
jgi:hypothetical protein